MIIVMAAGGEGMNEYAHHVNLDIPHLMAYIIRYHFAAAYLSVHVNVLSKKSK